MSYILENTTTHQFFCEFSEHVPIDTPKITEAAQFEKPSDAELIKVHLWDEYKIIPSFITQKS